MTQNAEVDVFPRIGRVLYERDDLDPEIRRLLQGAFDEHEAVQVKLNREILELRETLGAEIEDLRLAVRDYRRTISNAAGRLEDLDLRYAQIIEEL